MIVLDKGSLSDIFDKTIQAGACIEEPGDNCWLQLD